MTAVFSECSSAQTTAVHTDSQAVSPRPCSSLQQFDIAPEELEYRWEGNFTLVASHNKTRRVLRFRKTEAELPPVEDNVTFVDANNKDRCSCPTHLYAELVIRHLLGDTFLLPLEVAHIDSPTLRFINSSMHPHRPELRRSKQIDTHHHGVVVTRDAAYLPLDMEKKWLQPGSMTLCVEIKPKQGFICAADLRLAGDCNKTVCRFCLRQFALAKKDQCQIQSHYCPCDLFSGDQQRMLDALRGIVETPQNNFQVLRDAKRVYQSDSPIESLTSCLQDFFQLTADQPASVNNRLIASFLQTLYQTLTREFAEATESAYPGNSTYSQFCSRLKRELASSSSSSSSGKDLALQQTHLSPNCVLGRVLSVQLLDRLGIEGTLEHYRIVAAFLQERGATWHCSNGSLKDFADSLNAPLSVTQSAQHYEAYLTSLVAKDCSIMITMAPSCLAAADLPASVPHVADPISGRGILFSTAIVDLDPKPFDRIEMLHAEFLRLKLIDAATI